MATKYNMTHNVHLQQSQSVRIQES